MMSPFAAWTVSIAATVASTWALDAFAAAVGGGLVASGLLDDLSHPWVLVFLIVSYAAWAVGLRANLLANGRLLAATGASTNVLSKAAYDLVRRRRGEGRPARVAAAVAYTGTEIAKEVPYYTAAFGAAVFTDTITADEALVFLGGANLGAAFYEYGLARLTGVVIHRNGRTPRTRPAPDRS
jgi:hypothetical protein